jgi:hypothetical protein
MCRRARVELAVQPTAPREARRFVADVCERWGLSAMSSDIALSVSELVTNVILHAKTPMALTIDVAHDVVEVAVRDHDPRPPVLRPPREDLLTDVDTLTLRLPPAEEPEDVRHPALHVGPSGSIAAGRGMLIVDAVADEWGVADRATGKDVWFRLRVPEGWTHPDPCCCPQASHTTAGGLPVRHATGPWDHVAPAPVS